jgi:hypothetical protein
LCLPLLPELGLGDAALGERLGSSLTLLGEVLSELSMEPAAKTVKALLIDK